MPKQSATSSQERMDLSRLTARDLVRKNRRELEEVQDAVVEAVDRSALQIFKDSVIKSKETLEELAWLIIELFGKDRFIADDEEPVEVDEQSSEEEPSMESGETDDEDDSEDSTETSGSYEEYSEEEPMEESEESPSEESEPPVVEKKKKRVRKRKQ